MPQAIENSMVCYTEKEFNARWGDEEESDGCDYEEMEHSRDIDED